MSFSEAQSQFVAQTTEQFRQIAQLLWPLDEGKNDAFPLLVVDATESIAHQVRMIAYEIFSEHLTRAWKRVDAQTRDQLPMAVAQIFGPRFTAHDIEDALDPKGYNPDNQRAFAAFKAMEKELAVDPSGGLIPAMVRATVETTVRNHPSNLARKFASVADATLQLEQPTVLGNDRASTAAKLKELFRHAPSELTPTSPGVQPQTKRIARTKQLRDYPELVNAVDANVPQSIDMRKIELFEILRVLTNVVNTDINRYLDAADTAGERVRRLASLSALSSDGFKVENSSLNDPQWSRYVARAARLIRETNNGQHVELFLLPDVEMVLKDIAIGYGALASEDIALKAATQLITAVDKYATEHDIATVLMNSPGLSISQAGLNVIQLNAFRDAASLPLDSEGTYEPVRDGFHIDNMVFDGERVSWRKDPRAFAIAKFNASRLEQTYNDLGRTDVEPVVGDIITDDIGATVTLTCPGLTADDFSNNSPIRDQWPTLVRGFAARELSRTRPSVRSIEIPGQGVAHDADAAIHTVNLADIKGMRVEVINSREPFELHTDLASTAGLKFHLERGTLHVEGTSSQPLSESEVLIIGVRALDKCRVVSSNVDQLVLSQTAVARVDIPDDGVLIADSRYARVTMGNGSHCLLAPGEDIPRPVVDLRTAAGASPYCAVVLNSLADRSVKITGAEELPLVNASRVRSLAPPRDPQQGVAGVWEIGRDTLSPELYAALRSASDWARRQEIELPERRQALRNKVIRLIEDAEYCASAVAGRPARQFDPITSLVEDAYSDSESLRTLERLATDERFQPETRALFQQRVLAVSSSTMIRDIEMLYRTSTESDLSGTARRLEGLIAQLGHQLQPDVTTWNDLGAVASQYRSFSSSIADQCYAPSAQWQIFREYGSTRLAPYIAFELLTNHDTRDIDEPAALATVREGLRSDDTFRRFVGADPNNERSLNLALETSRQQAFEHALDNW